MYLQNSFAKLFGLVHEHLGGDDASDGSPDVDKPFPKHVADLR